MCFKSKVLDLVLYLVNLYPFSFQCFSIFYLHFLLLKSLLSRILGLDFYLTYLLFLKEVFSVLFLPCYLLQEILSLNFLVTFIGWLYLLYNYLLDYLLSTIIFILSKLKILILLYSVFKWIISFICQNMLICFKFLFFCSNASAAGC